MDKLASLYSTRVSPPLLKNTANPFFVSSDSYGEMIRSRKSLHEIHPRIFFFSLGNGLSVSYGDLTNFRPQDSPTGPGCSHHSSS